MKKDPNRLTARCDNNGDRTRIVSQYATYPVRFVQLENEVDCSHVYVLGYGGGLVGGDVNIIHMNVEEKAKLCLRTQGSTKIYKSTGNCGVSGSTSSSGRGGSISSNDDSGGGHQIMECSIQKDALLCVLPDPIVGYLGASYKQQQTYSLKDNTASLVVVDWFSCGRGREYNTYTNGRKSEEVGNGESNSSSSEFWGQKCIQSDMKIIRDGKVILIDNLLLDSTCRHNGLSISERVNHADVFGTVILVGEHTKNVATKLHTLCRRESFHQHSSNIGKKRKSTMMTNEISDTERIEVKDPMYSYSRIGEEEDAYVFRFVAYSMESGYKLLAGVLKSMGEIIGVDPYKDRLQGVEKYEWA